MLPSCHSRLPAPSVRSGRQTRSCPGGRAPRHTWRSREMELGMRIPDHPHIPHRKRRWWMGFLQPLPLPPFHHRRGWDRICHPFPLLHSPRWSCSSRRGGCSCSGDIDADVDVATIVDDEGVEARALCAVASVSRTTVASFGRTNHPANEQPR